MKPEKPLIGSSGSGPAIPWANMRCDRSNFAKEGGEDEYFTNVCDPTVLPLLEIARLYARSFDIELAFLTLKRELGLHLIWSSKSVVVLAQVWACLIIAQVLQGSRMEVALRAEVAPFEVSLPLLIEALPQFGSQGRDGMVECVRQGRRLGIIRPSTRLHIQAPEIPRDLLIPLPKDTPFVGSLTTIARPAQPHRSHQTSRAVQTHRVAPISRFILSATRSSRSSCNGRQDSKPLPDKPRRSLL
jgi:hypothetical protein